MEDHDTLRTSSAKREPWNKGKFTGAKPPLRPKHVWSIRSTLQAEGRTRDLAMFNLAIDSKLRLRCRRIEGRGCCPKRLCSRSGNGPAKENWPACSV
jgi:hypothetical protein